MLGDHTLHIELRLISVGIESFTVTSDSVEGDVFSSSSPLNGPAGMGVQSEIHDM